MFSTNCEPLSAMSAEVCDGRDNDCDGQTDECQTAGDKCLSNGQCGQCVSDGDCSSQAMVCVDAVCRNNHCMMQAKPDYSGCTPTGSASDGYCMTNTCTALKPVTVNDTDMGSGLFQVSYVGSWTTASIVQYASDASASATVKFVGKSIKLIGGHNTDHGVGSCYICTSPTDCTWVADFDAYGDQAWSQELCHYSASDVALRWFKVTPKGTKDAASTGTIVDVDNFLVNY